MEEHEENIKKILKTLKKAQLYCSLKKSDLFCMEIDFLGHHIFKKGIKADASKIKKILNWPRPKRAKHVWQFLGLVWYIAIFLPALIEHTSRLTLLTKKEFNMALPLWTDEHQKAFDGIKQLMVGHDCLTTIEHENPGKNKIFVTCDASKRWMRAILSFGESWKLVQPVAFESRQLTPAEKNYPTYKYKMLAIIHVLHKWRTDLLGSCFEVYTDYKTLKNFNSQQDLSKCQMWWNILPSMIIQ